MQTSVRRYVTITVGPLVNKNKNKNKNKNMNKNRNGDFNFPRRARKLCYYGDIIHSYYRKSAVEHDGGV